MPGAIVRIDGMKECRESLQELSRSVQRGVGRRSLAAAAEIFKRRIEQRAPVGHRPSSPGDEPGGLKESIKVVTARARRGDDARIAILATDQASAHVEYGTHKMAAQPFFRPGIEDGRNEAGLAMAASLREEVDSAAARAARKA